MSYLTEKLFDESIEGYERINVAVQAFGEEYISKCSNSDWFEGAEIEDGSIVIRGSYTHCGSCGTDYESYYVPTSYLYSDNWVEIEQASQAEERKLKEARKELEAAEREEKREAERHAKYLKMKEEYED